MLELLEVAGADGTSEEFLQDCERLLGLGLLLFGNLNWRVLSLVTLDDLHEVIVVLFQLLLLFARLGFLLG